MRLWKRLAGAGAMVLMLVAGCTSRNAESDYAREKREREWAMQLLSEAPAVERPLMAAESPADADWIALVRVDAGEHSVTIGVNLQYVPDEVLDEPWPEEVSRWFGGFASIGMSEHGVMSTGEGFANDYGVNVSAAGMSGAIFAVWFTHHGTDTATLRGIFPVLWSVPVQTFYWPEGMVRMRLLPADEARSGEAE